MGSTQSAVARWENGTTSPRFEHPPFDPVRIFTGSHDIRYVVIGGVAAALHGSPLTGDADTRPDDDPANLTRLADALIELGAQVSAPGVARGLRFDVTAETLAGARIRNLVCDGGRLDIAFEPSGTRGFADLHRRSVLHDLDGVLVPVAALEDVIRSKEAAGRERDRMALPTLRRLLERTGE